MENSVAPARCVLPRHPQLAGDLAQPRPQRGRPWWIAGRVLFSVVSLVMLGAAGVGWTKYNDIVDGTVTADVLDDGAGAASTPGDGATDILLVGMDSRVDAQGHPLPPELLAKLNAGQSDGEINTDTLILLRVPNNDTKAIGVSIPRDSYVDIPGGHGKHKINSAYGRAKLAAMRRLRTQGVSEQAQLEMRSSQEGAQTLVKTIQQLTGSTIDHYAQVNLLGFNDITEAVGGVEVCLLNPVNDTFSGARFPKGPQTVSGTSALAFVRQRHGLPRGDLDRIVRQQVFLKSLAGKVLSAGVLTDQGKLDSLLGSLKKSIVLDQHWTLVDFARQTQGLSDGVEFPTIPTGTPALKTPADGVAVEVTPSEVQQFVKPCSAATLPPAQAASPPARTIQHPAASRTVPSPVDVRNANGTRGLAGKIATILTKQGFTLGDTTTVAARSTTVVRYPKGEKASAEKVATALDTPMTLEQDTTIDAGHVVVILGKDYQGNAANDLTGQPLLQLSPTTSQQLTLSGPNTTPCVN
jgi:LCP family protein required for cell wall assembly